MSNNFNIRIKENPADYTLCILKPDIIKKKNFAEVLDFIIKNGFEIVSIKSIYMDEEVASNFYKEHENRPFFSELLGFMTEGMSIPMVLYKKNTCVSDFRELAGATNPINSKDNTIRKLYGTDVMHNAVHGSDSEESAIREISFFF